MRHPSKHRFFFSRFLVPDRRYSDSAAGTFWTANRFTKTRTFQNFSKHATWKTHAKSQHTAEFGKKTARIRGRLVHKTWSFEKLCQVREIVPNGNKNLRFFARKNEPKYCALGAVDVFLQAHQNLKMTTKSEQSPAEPRQAGSSEAKPSRFDRHQPAGLIHPNTRSPASGGLYW